MSCGEVIRYGMLCYVDEEISIKSYLDHVVHLDLRVGVANGAAIVGGDVWHGLLRNLLATHAAQLERFFLVADAVQGVP